MWLQCASSQKFEAVPFCCFYVSLCPMERGHCKLLLNDLPLHENTEQPVVGAPSVDLKNGAQRVMMQSVCPGSCVRASCVVPSLGLPFCRPCVC